MDTVYVLTARAAYDHPETIGIFPDRESAEVVRKFQQRRDSYEYEIIPWEVDKSGGRKNPSDGEPSW